MRGSPIEPDPVVGPARRLLLGLCPGARLCPPNTVAPVAIREGAFEHIALATGWAPSPRPGPVRRHTPPLLQRCCQNREHGRSRPATDHDWGCPSVGRGPARRGKPAWRAGFCTMSRPSTSLILRSGQADHRRLDERGRRRRAQEFRGERVLRTPKGRKAQ